MTRFLVVRHAESEWNAEGRWQGWSDPALSEGGRAQAAEFASRLDGFDGAVASSDLRRARETAEIVAERLGLGPVEVDAGLREIDVGDWSGLTMDEIRDRFPAEHETWTSGGLNAYPGGETRQHHLDRVLAALSRLGESFAGREVLVVTHGGSLSTLERMLGVHPGGPSTNLTGRWFVWDGSLAPVGDRVQLVGAAPPTARRAH